jgi:sugar lactone lactonase YvrE
MELERFIGDIDFGEGPRWHAGQLFYSDFYQHSVFSVTPEGRRTTVVEIDDQPSGLGWLPNGDLLIVAMKSRRILRFDGRNMKRHADLSHLAEDLCNDMVVNSNGHAYVGNFGFDFRNGAPIAATRLIHVDPEGRTRRVGSELRFPNGSVISPDGSTLIVGETMGGRYTAFDLAPDGDLSGERCWASIPGVVPDGCTLDADGAIWCADAGPGQAVLRIAAGGEILDRIPTPDPTFACMLGGVDGRTLFVFTAPGPSEAQAAGKRAGVIWTASVRSPRAGLP